MTTDTIIARRSTFDGKHVCLWSDGSLTWALGLTIKGSANPRTAEQRELALRTGWLVLGDVEIHNADEVSALVRAARWTAERTGLPGDMRTRLAALHAPSMPGTWSEVTVDHRGVTLERVWRFPRLSVYADFAIWHVRGRYRVLRRMLGTTDTHAPTGDECMSLGAAFAAVRAMTPA
jgi:hypothetical protein